MSCNTLCLNNEYSINKHNDPLVWLQNYEGHLEDFRCLAFIPQNLAALYGDKPYTYETGAIIKHGTASGESN